MRVCWKTASIALFFVWVIAFAVAYSSLTWWQVSLLITVGTIVFAFLLNTMAYYSDKKAGDKT